MNIQWFGWLTKGHYEVTFLDKIIGFTEFAVLVMAIVFTVAFIDLLKSKK